MPSKVEALGVFLILLPGFTCAYVAQYLSVRRKQTELDKVIEALLFSVVLYVSTLPFFGNTLPVSWRALSSDPNQYQILIRWSQLFVLALGSCVLGILYAANINHDWIMKLFRRIRVTERTARSTIWNDVFQEIGGSVQVGLTGEIKVIGYLRYYSDEAEDSSMFLKHAAWIDSKGNTTPITGPGILLTKDVGIEYILFLDPASEDAGDERNSEDGQPLNGDDLQQTFEDV
jgi:hypothetical protein